MPEPPVLVSVAAPAPPHPRAPGPAESGQGSGSDFAPLLRLVREQGLLDRRPGWYAAGITLNLALLAATGYGLVLLRHSWWALALAPVLAVLSARAAFFGHDAGHRQIAASARANRAVQLLHAELLLGMSQSWWNEKHARHHAHPNDAEKDPDVAPDVIVFRRDQAAERTGARAFLTRHQAWLFLPLTTLEAVALKVHGFRAVLTGRGRHIPARRRALQGALLVAHVCGYCALLLAVLSPLQALAFAVLHQALLGLHLGLSFAPNHKGMPMPEPGEEKRWDHLRRQVLTSRNVRGGPVTDWLLGGLGYQIEHHLFPSMPRPHLRLARPLVRAHCRSLGLPYTETGALDSYRQALGHLHDVGVPLRKDA